MPIIELSREEGDNLNSLFEKYKVYSNIDENLVKIFEIVNNELLSKNEILKLFNNCKFLKEVMHCYLKKENIIEIFTDKVNKN